MTSDKTLSGLVTDWGGFEQLIADVHGSPGFTVERNVKLPAKEGGTYQIDVVLRWQQGIYNVMMICECKWLKRPVDRARITHLKHVREQVGADKAACFTSVGFQSGAEEVARAHDINLYLVRDLTDEEWGAPGPVVNIVMQMIQVAISPITFLLLDGPSIALPMSLDPESIVLTHVDGTPAGTMASICDQIREKALAVRPNVLMGGGAAGTYYQAVKIDDGRFANGPRIIRIGPQTLRAIGLSCEVVFQLREELISVNRRENFDFALIVEDFVRGNKYSASRRVGSAAELGPLITDPPDPTRPVMQNGQVLQLLVKGFGDYEQFAAEMTRIEVAQQK